MKKSALNRQAVWVVAVVTVATVALAHIAGAGHLAAAAAETAFDRVPVMAGLEREVTIQLREPVHVQRLPLLAAEWRVRVQGFQHTYAAPHLPITMGATTPGGTDLTSAVTDAESAASGWAASRLDRMRGLAAGMTGVLRQSMERNIEDLKIVQASIASSGVLASRVDVRGSVADVDRLLGHPLVQSVQGR